MLSVEWVVSRKRRTCRLPHPAMKGLARTNNELKSKLRHHLTLRPPVHQSSTYHTTHTVLFILCNDIDSISQDLVQVLSEHSLNLVLLFAACHEVRLSRDDFTSLHATITNHVTLYNRVSALHCDYLAACLHASALSQRDKIDDKDSRPSSHESSLIDT